MNENFYRTITAIALGNALEWYDFAIFGALADIIGLHFFPIKYESTALLASFGIYGSAFFMRPLGGIIMGYIGDTYGRKRALEISVALMLVPSFLIGCLPTFLEIGYFAPILLVLLRLLQGLAVGGEMIGAYVFTIESCEGQDHGGFWGGVCKSTALCGTALGMAVVAFMREYQAYDQLYAWGWRIPFLASCVLGGAASYLRYHINETDEFQRLKVKTPQSPSWWSNLKVVFAVHWVEIVWVILVCSFWSVGYYTCFVWLGYYTTVLIEGDEVSHAWLINIGMLCVLILLLPVGGYIGDKVKVMYRGGDCGHRSAMMAGALVMVVLGGPAFMLINMKTPVSVCAGQFIFAVSLGLFGGNLPIFMVPKFDAKYRYSGMGIAYNVANAIFAGTAPLLQTSLVMNLHKYQVWQQSPLRHLLPASYLALVGAMAFCALALGPSAVAYLRRSHWSSLDDSMSSANSSHAMSSKAESGYVASALDTSISPEVTMSILINGGHMKPMTSA